MSLRRIEDSAEPVSMLMCLLGCLAAPQTPGASPELAAFRALPAATQTTVLERIDTRLAQAGDPSLARIAALAATATAAGPRPAEAWYAPAEFAPAAPARVLVPADQPGHAAQRAQFPAPPFLPGLRAEASYDWGTGKVVRQPGDLGDRFAARLAGFPAGSDLAVAVLLEQFDADAEQRRIGSWFAHTYADRNGRVYAGITLYDAWYSGRTVEVPDVDAIAFARTVLRTASFESPIPDGRRRDRLYQQIHEAFGAYREYRTLREAAAAVLISPKPELDPVYQDLVVRMQFLWPRLGYDPAKVGQKLNAGDRSELLAVLDEAVREEASAAELRDAHRLQLRAMAELVRTTALEELRSATGK